jgi:hypothetical protein
MKKYQLNVLRDGAILEKGHTCFFKEKYKLILFTVQDIVVCSTIEILSKPSQIYQHMVDAQQKRS